MAKETMKNEPRVYNCRTISCIISTTRTVEQRKGLVWGNGNCLFYLFFHRNCPQIYTQLNAKSFFPSCQKLFSYVNSRIILKFIYSRHGCNLHKAQQTESGSLKIIESWFGQKHNYFKKLFCVVRRNEYCQNLIEIILLQIKYLTEPGAYIKM